MIFSNELCVFYPRALARGLEMHIELDKKYFQPQTMGDSFHHMFQHHFYLYITFQLYCVIIRYNIAVVPGRSAPAFEPTISKWRMINKRRFDETKWSIYRMGFYHFKIDVLPCSTEKVMKQIVNGKYYPQSFMNVNLLCFFN